MIAVDTLETIIPSSPEILLGTYRAEVDLALRILLDGAAQTFRYDNMLSVRSYAGYVNPFQSEALVLANWASDCWTKINDIELQIIAGIIEIPTIESVLLSMPHQPVL